MRLQAGSSAVSTYHRVLYRDGYIILAGDDIDVDTVIVGVINL